MLQRFSFFSPAYDGSQFFNSLVALFAPPVLISAQAVGLISVCLMLLHSAPLTFILHAGIVPNQTRI